MNYSFLRKLLAVAMASLLVVSMGANAAQKKCKSDEKWDPVKKECVKK